MAAGCGPALRSACKQTAVGAYMTTPENKVKVKVRALLDAYGAYRHSPVMNGMGAPTLDFVGCHRGRYFAIETKAPGKVPTPRQWSTIINIRTAGGKVFIIDGDTKELELWLLEW